jgi:TRAP-type C4-dicarboxylate transport system substrate-binding protein
MLVRNLAAIAAAGLATFAIAGEANATDCTTAAPCVLRIATIAPSNTPWADSLENMRQRIESESGGRIDVRVFLGQSDGEVSLARQCRDGSVEGVGVSTGALASAVPEMGVFELPYLFESASQADSIIDNHLFAPVEQLLRNAGYQIFIFSENGYRNFATSNGTIIHSPSDLGALQMRSQELWIHESMYRALGGNPVTIPASEVTTALSSGAVNGFDNTPLFAQAAGWHSFINAWTISDHIYQPAVIVYNRDWFDGLPADLQALLIANRQAETISSRRDIRALQPFLIDNLRASGITVYEMTDAERATFAAATESVHDEFRREVPSGAELLDIIYANR